MGNDQFKASFCKEILKGNYDLRVEAVFTTYYVLPLVFYVSFFTYWKLKLIIFDVTHELAQIL